MTQFLFAPKPPTATDTPPAADGGGSQGAPPAAPEGYWPVLIVDDDAEVHAVTRLALRKVTYKNRKLQLLSAYSAAEAEAMLRERQDIAVILLDVVMETEDAGLQLTRKIREDLGLKATRIILRTGQPGQAPEERVIVEYDINDYKAKTELTTQKLFTAIIAALRSYRDIITIEANRAGLEKIIRASDQLMEMVSITEFADGALLQVCSLLEQKPEGVICLQKAGFEKPTIIAGAGRFASLARASLDAVEDTTVRDAIRQAFDRRENIYLDTATTLYLRAEDGNEVAALALQRAPLRQDDRRLLELFATKISASFTNVLLYEKLLSANEQLTLANEELERRVAERTAELQKANELLTEMASTDCLTKICNRRRLFELGAQELKRSDRTSEPFSIILFDLDRFKSINDSFGHDAGDEILRQAALRAASCLRLYDTLARHGGEEFAVLLPETQCLDACAVAERIRSHFACLPVLYGKTEIPFTASFGIATRREGESFEEVLKRADSALYLAKEQGRNQVQSMTCSQAVANSEDGG
ncbi:DUF3369 domain-containing protein [Megalodesulfovibrio paquesii]